MKIHRTEKDLVHVSLSRRNIENLLHMLDNRTKTRPSLENLLEDTILLVEAEENDEHYGEREPGKMSWERV